jgi:hypothetical protein
LNVRVKLARLKLWNRFGEDGRLHLLLLRNWVLAPRRNFSSGRDMNHSVFDFKFVTISIAWYVTVRSGNVKISL